MAWVFACLALAVRYRKVRFVPNADKMRRSKKRVIRSPRRRVPAASAGRQCRGARGLQIDDELELGRLQNRKINRFGAVQYASSVHSDLPKHFGNARP
jgi:hypothetical protein